MYDEVAHHTHQKGLSIDNSVCKPQTAPNHKEHLCVKMMTEEKLQLVAPHLILHCIASPSPHYRYSNTTLTDHMKTMTALVYNFHKSWNKHF